MGSREELQAKLEQLLGSRNVYYMPPESVQIHYPAIIYSPNKIKTVKADNITYLKNNEYSVTVIDRLPDNPVIGKILELPYASYDRPYVFDNLFHDVLTLYF